MCRDRCWARTAEHRVADTIVFSLLSSRDRSSIRLIWQPCPTCEFEERGLPGDNVANFASRIRNAYALDDNGPVVLTTYLINLVEQRRA